MNTNANTGSTSSTTSQAEAITKEEFMAEMKKLNKLSIADYVMMGTSVCVLALGGMAYFKSRKVGKDIAAQQQAMSVPGITE